RLSNSANHSVGSRMGSRRTPRPTRRMRTRSPRNLNSCGRRTAWLRPLRKSFATPASGISNGDLLIYTARIYRQSLVGQGDARDRAPCAPASAVGIEAHILCGAAELETSGGPRWAGVVVRRALDSVRCYQA